MTNLIYLGNYADVDPYEGDYDSEYAHDLVGVSADSNTMQIVSVYQYDYGNDNVIRDNESSCDYIGYDVGSGTVYNYTDSTLLGTVAVTLSDGSVQHIQAVLIQQDNGDLFVTDLLNEGTLDNLSIAHIEIKSIDGNCYSGWYADQSVDGSTIAPVVNLDGYVEGTGGNDVIDVNYTGDPDGDCIDANDQILPGEGSQDDIVLAGAGDDLVMANLGNDEIYGGEGNDTLCGQDGDDTIYGGAGDDILEGMRDNDLLFGQDGNDRIYGDGGDDVAVGGTGADRILGGSGQDELYGGLGDDRITAGADDDVAYGGAGSDTISGGGGADTLYGGGVDFSGKIDFNDLATGELVNGQYVGSGMHVYSADPTNPVMIFDTANPTGGDHDLATGNLGNVLILSEDRDGNDPDDNAGGGTFVFEFEGEASVQSLDFLDIERGATIKLYDGNGTLIDTIDVPCTSDNGQLSQSINVDGVARMEVTIVGSGAIDNICYTLVGDAQDAGDVIDGGLGDDVIFGGAGDDDLTGGDGADEIYGGDDADVIHGGAGDVVDGGAGGNDHDVLDLTGQGPFYLVGPDGTGLPVPDSNGNGIDGQVIFVDADGNPTGQTLSFTEIEEVIGDEVNRGPDALDDGYDAGEDDSAAVVGNVLGNDSDPDGDALSVGAVGGDAGNVGTPVAGDNGGLVTIAADGTVTFDPNGDFEALGEDETTTTSVSYTISDGNGGTDTATVTITVTGVNDGPVAVDNAYTVAHDETAGDVDGNVLTDNTGDGVDSDPENDTLTVVGVGAAVGSVGVPVAGDNGGLITINADGSVDFDPNGDFGGLGLNDSAQTSVTYTISDGNGGTDTATVTFTITGINNGVVEGTDGNDVMTPGYVDGDGDIVDGNDAILPPDVGDDDRIFGYGGDDSIEAGNGNDKVFGGDGNDTIDGNDGDDILVGDAGNDVIDGGAGMDMLFGGIGDDTLYGRGDNDKLEGGAGDDRLFGGGGDDDLWGGGDNDVIGGGSGNDNIDAGSGDDTISGGSGDDVINGQSGNDVIDGGTGDDQIDGSFGDDQITGGEGSDVIEGGNGNDVINAGNHVDPQFDNPYPGLGDPDPDPFDDRDVVFGGSGNDVITTGDDADTIDGGTGNDFIDAGIDNDSVTGGDGDDTIIGGEGVDLIDGGDGDDLIYGGLDNDTFDIPDDVDLLPGNNIDTIEGGAGNDTIFGRDDDDVLFGGTGDDTLDGGIDEDTLDGGEGNDTLIGGQGADQLFGGLGNDVFLRGTAGDVVVGGEDPDLDGDGQSDDVDVLDLTGANVERIEYVPGDPEAGTVFFTDGTTMTFSEIENVIPCFTPGTMIATPRGEKPVEELQVGDKVITRDNGIQEIAWMGQKALNGKQLAANPHLKPILIKAGSLGQGLPERDMLVSPNHRILVASELTQLYFEEREVLAAAKHMTGADGIHQVNVLNTTYVHFMCERHEVVLSNGSWTESFQPGDYSLKGIGNSQRNEIFELFPELATKTGLGNYQAARKALKKHEARLLVH